jgi:hypothetical protein
MTQATVPTADHNPLSPHLQRICILQPVRLAYQPPASSTFLSEQTSHHQQPASGTFLPEQSAPATSQTNRLLKQYNYTSSSLWDLLLSLSVF